jgi:hypothetical protein
MCQITARTHRLYFYLPYLAICLIFTQPGLLHGQTGSGMITGIVEAQDESPIPGAILIYGWRAPSHGQTMVAMVPPVMSVSAGADGRFTIEGLAAGTYLVCVQVSAADYLDPCHWSAAPPSFVVAAGQTVSGAVIKVTKRARLPISVSDPQHSITAQGATRMAPPVIGAMAVSGAFIAAELTTRTTTGRTYTVTLPFDALTGVFVSGGSYQLTDASANAVASGGRLVQVTVPSNGTPPNLSFTVKGINPPQ